jgi:hypothetical protein
MLTFAIGLPSLLINDIVSIIWPYHMTLLVPLGCLRSFLCLFSINIYLWIYSGIWNGWWTAAIASADLIQSVIMAYTLTVAPSSTAQTIYLASIIFPLIVRGYYCVSVILKIKSLPYRRAYDYCLIVYSVILSASDIDGILTFIASPIEAGQNQSLDSILGFIYFVEVLVFVVAIVQTQLSIYEVLQRTNVMENKRTLVRHFHMTSERLLTVCFWASHTSEIVSW